MFSRHRLRPSLGPLLELIGLSGLAVAQPVFADFRKGADTFVAYGAGRWDIVLFVLGIVLGVPLALYLVELLAGLVAARAAQLVHAVAVAVLLAALASEVVKSETEMGWKRVAAIAAVVGVAGAAAVWRWQAARLFVRFLAVASVWFAAVFLFSSPITPLVVSSERVAAASVEVGAPAPVVWIILDELPLVSLLDGDDRIDESAFPNLASLAEDATWYRNSTTVATNTPQAVPALLSGRFPEDESTLPVAVEHEHNLFTLLGDQYHLHVSEGWTRLCPENLCDGIGTAERAAWPRLLREARYLWEEEASPKRPERNFRDRWETGERRSGQIEDFVGNLDSSDDGRPRLDFLHVLLPHSPFNHVPTGQQYRAPAFPVGTFLGGWFDEDAAEAARQRHVLQAAYADRVVGRILDQVRALDRYDDSLIVVTADHGAAFTAGSPWRHTTEDNFAEVLWTPLLIKAPRQTTGAVDDTVVRAVDVLPTVADLLDVELPWAVDGRPIGSGRRPDDELRFFQSVGGKLPTDDHQVATVDAEEGFRRVLDAPPAGSGRGELALYRQGRYGALVGRRVSEVASGDPVTLEGVVHQAPALEDVDPQAPEVPAYLSGEVTTVGPDPSLAVALNGVVAGWAHGYLPSLLPPGLDPSYSEEPQPRRWSTMVPPALLRDGANRLELFRIDGEPDAPALRPIRLRR